jgi:hypothetical protein
LRLCSYTQTGIRSRILADAAGAPAAQCARVGHPGQGQERGSNPHAFSKIGDCESRTTWFLGNFDLGEEYYNLGPYAEELGPVVVYYAGSFNRLSQAANPGFTAASLLSPLRADPKSCEKSGKSAGM